MILKDDANQWNSLFHLSLKWARSDDTNFTFEDFIVYFNPAINKLTALIMRHDRNWNWLDKNATGQTLIDATTALAVGVSAYPISTPWLKIARVRIKDPNGTLRTLKNVNRADLTDEALISTDDIHTWYLLGNSLCLGGVPSYGYAGGVEVQFQTGAVHFTPSDATKSVGFDVTFEELAALMPAQDYLDINGPAEQAEKVRVKIGAEPMDDIRGSGLLNALAIQYEKRDDSPQTLSLASSRTGGERARGTLY